MESRRVIFLVSKLHGIILKCLWMVGSRRHAYNRTREQADIICASSCRQPSKCLEPQPGITSCED